MAQEIIIQQDTADYNIAVQTIKEAILRSQYQAAKLVNREMLSLYYGIGRYVSANSRKGFWGTNAIETISERLRKELPGLKGFSTTSLKKMRQFYEQWEPVISKSTATAVKLPITTDEIDIDSLLCAIPTTVAVDFNIEEFLEISFSHHIEILNKVTDIPTRNKYIHIALDQKWPAKRLREEITRNAADYYGAIPSNFGVTIKDSRDAIKALNMFKEGKAVYVSHINLDDSSKCIFMYAVDGDYMEYISIENKIYGPYEGVMYLADEWRWADYKGPNMQGLDKPYRLGWKYKNMFAFYQMGQDFLFENGTVSPMPNKYYEYKDGKNNWYVNKIHDDVDSRGVSSNGIYRKFSLLWDA